MSNTDSVSEKSSTETITIADSKTQESEGHRDVYTKKTNVSASISGAILLYIILFNLSFIVLFSFNPSIISVQNYTGTGTAPPDASRCFISSLIIALVICIIIWLFTRSC